MTDWSVSRVTMNSTLASTSEVLSSIAASATVSSQISSNSSGYSVFDFLAVVVATVGIVANICLAAAVILTNRVSSNPTHILIANQCLLDSLYSLGSFISVVVKIAGVLRYSDPPTALDNLKCVLFDSDSFGVTFQNCSTASLMAMTLERYFKVVYPIEHRKYYRSWMIRVTIVMTWLSGFVTYLLPNSLTTRIFFGICYLSAAWPSATLSKV